jgi:hypothetical protein
VQRLKHKTTSLPALSMKLSLSYEGKNTQCKYFWTVAKEKYFGRNKLDNTA